MQSKSARLSWLACVLGLVFAGASFESANAADLPPRTAPPVFAAPQPQWAFSANAYVWLTGLNGTLRTLPPFPAVNVNLSIGDVLSHLDGGLMGSFEARYDRVVLFTDLIAAKLSAGKSFAVVGYPGNVSLSSGSFVGLGAAGYRIFTDGRTWIDAFAGIRGFSMTNTLKVAVAPVALQYQKSEGWVDGVVGARFRFALADRWSATAIGFVGAGGSKYEWDLFGGLNYDVRENMTAFAGFRALKTDYTNGSFVYNAIQSGPVIGFRYTF